MLSYVAEHTPSIPRSPRPGESHAWLAFLNTLFLVITPLVASGYAAGAYTVNGSIVVLTMGSGLFLLAFSSLIANDILHLHSR